MHLSGTLTCEATSPSMVVGPRAGHCTACKAHRTSYECAEFRSHKIWQKNAAAATRGGLPSGRASSQGVATLPPSLRVLEGSREVQRRAVQAAARSCCASSILPRHRDVVQGSPAKCKREDVEHCAPATGDQAQAETDTFMPTPYVPLAGDRPLTELELQVIKACSQPAHPLCSFD